MVTKLQLISWLAAFGDQAQFALDTAGYLTAVDDRAQRALPIGDGPAGWCSLCSASQGHLPTCETNAKPANDYGVVSVYDGEVVMATRPMPKKRALDLASRLANGFVVPLDTLLVADRALRNRAETHLNLGGRAS